MLGWSLTKTLAVILIGLLPLEFLAEIYGMAVLLTKTAVNYHFISILGGISRSLAAFITSGSVFSVSVIVSTAIFVIGICIILSGEVVSPISSLIEILGGAVVS